MTRERPWIPPGGLLYSQLAHGFSWILLLYAGLHPPAEIGFAALAWVHTVALGWLTMAALSVLIFAVPIFTGTPLQHETVARGSLWGFGAGTALLVAGFLGGSQPLLVAAAFLIVAALCAYLVPMLRTLLAALRSRGTARAIARALLVTLAALSFTALLGLVFTLALDGAPIAAILAMGPAIHAQLGTIGWLSLLVFGVSVRTVRAIAGSPPARPVHHVVVGTLAVVGVVLLIAGLAAGAGAAKWVAVAILCGAAVAYAAWMWAQIAGASVKHRPPQAFLAAASLWLVVAALFGIAIAAGFHVQASYIFAALVGWIGQMLNGHVHHIGTRLIATIVRGDADETRPEALLTPALSWMTFTAFQVAIALGLLGLTTGMQSSLVAAALCGFTGWLCMIGNLARAAKNAHPAAQSGITIAGASDEA